MPQIETSRHLQGSPIASITLAQAPSKMTLLASARIAKSRFLLPQQHPKTSTNTKTSTVIRQDASQRARLPSECANLGGPSGTSSWKTTLDLLEPKRKHLPQTGSKFINKQTSLPQCTIGHL